MQIILTQGMDGRFIAHADTFTLVETSSGWARTLAEHPDRQTCLDLAHRRAQAVGAGTLAMPDTHIFQHSQ